MPVEQFRLVYQKGSFVRSELFALPTAALLRACHLIAEEGVHCVRIEDENGRTILSEAAINTRRKDIVLS